MSKATKDETNQKPRSNMPAVLGFLNGVLVLPETGDFLLEPHAAEHIQGHGYDFAFQPELLEPEADSLWARYMAGLFVDDVLAKVTLLQEFYGACLLGIATKAQTALILHSKGEPSGRSSHMRIIGNVFPESERCSISPNLMGTPWKIAHLKGKKINLVDAMTGTDLLGGDVFKAAVSGGPMLARPKYQNPYAFRPVAGHVMAVYNPRTVRDDSEGFGRRLIKVEFDRVFAGTAGIANLEQLFSSPEQIQRIVHWMLAGARRLSQRDYQYIVPESSWMTNMTKLFP